MRCLLVMAALLALLPVSAEPLVFQSLDGTRHAVFAGEDSKAAVLVFIDTECPIANAYHPELRRLEKEFGRKGVRFFLIHADGGLDPERARKHAAEFDVTALVVIDKGQAWVKKTGASVTPEAVVITPDGKTVYQGRIDDRYADYGKKRPEPKQRDLREALEAVLAGKAVARPRTDAVGCLIFVE